jgi:16S rRNA G527 N7-methylase RsmG
LIRSVSSASLITFLLLQAPTFAVFLSTTGEEEMQFTRRQSSDFLSAWAERDALARAEYLCDQAEALHNDAKSQADQVLAQARADAARLLREAIAVCDENVARAQAARRQQELNELAARAAREEAERILTSAREIVAAESELIAANAEIDLRDLAQVAL